MARYVIDAPTLLAVVTAGDPIHPDHRLVAPASIRSQCLDLLLAEVSAGARRERDALALHDRITETKLRALNDRVSRAVAWRIARERSWDSIRDAEYVAVTTLQADALVTVDDDLRSRASGIVEVLPLGALYAP